jgi:hypothetical protein
VSPAPGWAHQEVAPDAERPTLTVFEVAGAEYRQEAHATGDTPLTISRPFRLRLAPASLVAGLRP